MYFSSVKEGDALDPGCEWNIPTTSRFLFSASSYALISSSLDMVKLIGEFSIFFVKKISLTIKLSLFVLPNKIAQDSFGMLFLECLVRISI